MANGSHKYGPAAADRLREENARHERFIQSRLDELPPYTEDESQAELTGSFKGITAKLGLPRWTRGVLGICLSLGLLALLIAISYRLIK